MAEVAAVVLLVSTDPGLVARVQGLAAGAGVEPALVADAASAMRAWPEAHLVLVGVDLAAQVAQVRPTRRDAVYVVSAGPVEDHLFRVALELGAESVLDLARGSSWLAQVLSDLADPRPAGRVLAVLPGSGGAGATTLACALGQVAARRGPSLVLDLDPGGPGVDRVLGMDGEPGLGWEALAATSGRLSGSALRESVPRQGGVGVLTWGHPVPEEPAVEVLRETLRAAARGHDLVVVDLPRGAGQVSEEVVARSDRVLLVVRPTLTGLAAARRQLAALDGRGGLVLRGRGLGADVVAETVGAPVLAEMADQSRLQESVDLGLGPVRGRRGPLARAAAELLAGVSGSPVRSRA